MSTEAPPSYQAWTAHLSRSFHWHLLTIAKRKCLYMERCVFRRASPVIYALGVRWIFIEYYAVFARMRQCARYVSDCKWYLHCSCVIRAWFVSDFCPRHPKNLVNFSTHKHAQTQSVRDLYVIRAWSAVWLALKIQDSFIIEVKI